MYSPASTLRVSCFRHRIVVWMLLAVLFSSWLPSVGMAQDTNDVNIEAIQSSLQQLGYNPGPIDGLMGQKTAAAITAFQTDLNLPVDGEPSAELFAVLQREIAKATGPTATIRELEGTVLVSGQSVSVGTVLIAGDMIETRVGSSAILELSDGSTLELREKTQLDIADLAQTDTGGRVSRLKLLWGRIRATLSPGHQRADSKFDIETPNALVGVKFSPPRLEIMYDEEEAETVAVATVELVAKNLLTDETVLVPMGSSVVITNTTIELIAGIIEFVTSTDYELPEVRPSGIEDTRAELPVETEEAAETTEIVETETTAAEGTTGLSTGKMIAIGAGALGALGGIALIAGGGDGGSSSGDGDPGGRGDISFTLTWSYSGGGAEGPDIDLWVIDPLGQKLSCSRDGYALGPTPQGGRIDYDDQGDSGPGDGGGPERAYWPEGQAPRGTYTYGVQYFYGTGTADYTLRVYIDNRVVSTQTGTLYSEGGDITVGTINF